MRKTLAAIVVAFAAFTGTASAAVYQPEIIADTAVVHVGDTVTLTNPVPCPSTCSQKWTWFNGINRLGYFMGYGSTVDYTFGTARSGPVQIDVGIPTYPGSRLVKHYTAAVYVTVLP